MTKCVEIVDQIQWYEGMLLAPQHFQQENLRDTQILRYFLGQLSPYFWGVQVFETDPARFAAGVINVLAYEIILPDATILSSGNTASTLVEYDLTPFAEALAQDPMKLYLIVPTLQEDGSNFDGPMARYQTVDDDQVADLGASENKLRLSRVRLNASFLLSKTPPPGRYISIPVAEVNFKDNAYHFTDYLPPVFTITRQSVVGQACLDIIQNVREKAAYLSDQIQEMLLSSTAAVNVGPLEMRLAFLNAGLPAMEGLLQTDHVHPFKLYLSLCRLAGEIAIMQPGQVAPQFDTYNHLDIYASFEGPITFLKKMLDLLQEKFQAALFTLDDRVFSLASNQVLDKVFYIAARPRTTAKQGDMANWLQTCVIASDSFVKSVRDKRVLGAARQIVQNPEDVGLLPGKDMVVVAVQYDPTCIRAGEPLRVFNISDTPETRPMSLTLYTQNPETPAAGASKPSGGSAT